MKRSSFKIIGVVLLFGAAIAAALIQIFGSGLVVTEHVSQHVQSSDPRVTLTAIDTTTYHALRILSLLAIAFVGVLFVVVSRRHERPVA
jgi:hypothetical protein